MAWMLMARLPCLIPYIWDFCGQIYVFMLLFSFSNFSDHQSLKKKKMKLHFTSFVSFRLVTNLNPQNYVTVSCLLHRFPYINASTQVVPVRNTWVRAHCSVQDVCVHWNCILWMLQTSNSDQPAQTASLMRVVIVGKTISQRWEINLAEGSHFEQSARIRRSVRVFAVATFQETLIKCLFFNENKHMCMIKMPY